MTYILKFNDPIGRKNYFIGFLIRITILIMLILLVSDFDEAKFLEILDSYQFQFFGTIIFLDLDIRRIKDIGITMNLLYIYYFLNLLPSSHDQSNQIYSIFDGLIGVLGIIFTLYLFFKKGSNNYK